ncbi:hypothetical protein [Fluviicola sp.]|uniref:hypothetical protein n=1 Tax=Fluviicola sp. TaxID=1917219 RepID=UPI0031DF7996
MKHAIFLLFAGTGSLFFGILLFFAPQIGAASFGMDATIPNESLLRGMGGLIIGTGIFNILFRKVYDPKILRSVFLVNIFTHLFGLFADYWGLFDGALTFTGILPVQITHLFIGGGSLIYLLKNEPLSKII